MKILILDPLSHSTLLKLLANNVVYRPDLLCKNQNSLGRELVAIGADAIITHASIPTDALNEWSAMDGQAFYWVQVGFGEVCASSKTLAAKKISPSHVIVLEASGADEESAYTTALDTLETEFSRCRVKPVRRERIASVGGDSHVVMVGAGLVNLIAAYQMQRAGYTVELIDAGPDPRSGAVWTEYGCSRGGDDARMFTLSEMDNYNDRNISTEMNRLFQNTVNHSGWNVQKNKAQSSQEQSWVSEFESIPVWLANRYNKDIFAFNRESWLFWEQWIQDDPELFHLSGLRKDILRLYSDADHYASAVQRQNHIGATQCLLSPEVLAAQHPGLADAVEAGHIAGGILVDGFTVNVHQFIHLLLESLEQAGAKLLWNERIKNIVFDAQNTVKGLRGTKKVFQAEHYVISPGAYGNTLLQDTRSCDKIHGVLGAWLRIPNVHPQLTHSLKLARKNHITEDANITIAKDAWGQPLLIIGSGYGHTGIDPKNIDPALLDDIYQGLVDTAKHYFPKAYQAALEAGTLQDSFKYCVRPWTASSLGLFEMQATQQAGHCIITGGHNTGGFAQAPAIANAVLAALSGREHPMHHAYCPDRTSAFLNSASRTSVSKETIPHLNAVNL